jgi:hypothetical protein
MESTEIPTTWPLASLFKSTPVTKLVDPQEAEPVAPDASALNADAVSSAGV